LHLSSAAQRQLQTPEVGTAVKAEAIVHVPLRTDDCFFAIASSDETSLSL